MYGQEKIGSAVSNLGGGCCVEPERNTPEVMKAMSDLRCVVELYDLLVGRLHDRLKCVVAPAPKTCSDVSKESGYCTELASAINDTSCKLRDITNRLESLYERIEL